jgi:hypothetical protein
MVVIKEYKFNQMLAQIKVQVLHIFHNKNFLHLMTVLIAQYVTHFILALNLDIMYHKI